MSNIDYWILLHKAPGLGTKGFLQALNVFGSPKAIFEADKESLKLAGIFKNKTLDFIVSPDISIIGADLKWLEKENHHLLTIEDEYYPNLLKEIVDPPPLLYVIGSKEVLNNNQLAMVGSRNPTQGGIENAVNFAQELSAYGLTIISGLASGIDSASHQGALNQKAPTIGVCGTGLDKVYPSKNRALAHQISMKGALVSELNIGTPPIAKNFPRRNRIISGLSIGTLVVEANIRSGSLITARLAVEQGREVFTIPSSIKNPQAKGCHYLIKQGAKLVENIDDILEELQNIELINKVKSINNENELDKNDNKKNTNTIQSKILKYVSYEAKTIDNLVELTKLPINIVNQEILMLELAGKISNTNGQGFILKE